MQTVIATVLPQLGGRFWRVRRWAQLHPLSDRDFFYLFALYLLTPGVALLLRDAFVGPLTLAEAAPVLLHYALGAVASLFWLGWTAVTGIRAIRG